MSFAETLMNGNEGLFKPTGLTPMQKLTLRFVVVGLVYYLFALIEGTIMRIYQIQPIAAIPTDQYFGIL
ncbi:MAG: cbb3-type cytochrome c oxidase subunit I, partial [Coriobacteriales bacterium]|nr:cbb3-type cytochrome c oxidase subunit I [Coriobacteriales bacterium]